MKLIELLASPLTESQWQILKEWVDKLDPPSAQDSTSEASSTSSNSSSTTKFGPVSDPMVAALMGSHPGLSREEAEEYAARM